MEGCWYPKTTSYTQKDAIAYPASRKNFYKKNKEIGKLNFNKQHTCWPNLQFKYRWSKHTGKDIHLYLHCYTTLNSYTYTALVRSAEQLTWVATIGRSNTISIFPLLDIINLIKHVPDLFIQNTSEDIHKHVQWPSH